MLAYIDISERDKTARELALDRDQPSIAER